MHPHTSVFLFSSSRHSSNRRCGLTGHFRLDCGIIGPARPNRGLDLGSFAVVQFKTDGASPVDPGDERLRSFVKMVYKLAWRREIRRRAPSVSKEDVAQEVLFRAVKRLAPLQGKDPDHHAAWLRTVMRNVVIDARRRRRQSLATETTWPGVHRVSPPTEEDSDVASTAEERAVSPDAGPLAAAIDAEFRETFARALERLPAAYREEILCWLLLGETRSQIARRQGRSRFQITSHRLAVLALFAKSFTGFRD